MPTASVASAREILTGLHDVMASRANAQTKLNKVVQVGAKAVELRRVSFVARGD